MESKTISKLEFFVNLFNNLTHKKNLTIFVGHNGVVLTALDTHTPLESIYIKNKDAEFKAKYQAFLSKYQKFYVSFLLDTKESKIDRHIIPVVGSMVDMNPVEKFIRKNHSKKDIVAYNVYNISHQDSEIWNTSIAYAKYTETLQELIEYTLYKPYKYSGTYILSLESEALIRKILQITKNQQYADHFQVFVTTLQSSGIKIIVKRKSSILYDLTFPLPKNKSYEYIKGTIEELARDQILTSRNYIERHKAPICIILLVSEELKATINDEFCIEYDVVTISPDELKLPMTKGECVHEESIINLFTHNNSHLAQNNILQQITKYNLLNNVMFKPIILLICALIFISIFLQYQIYATKSEAKSVNHEYYQLAAQYRDIVKTYPKPSEVNDLVDLYQLNQIIDQKPGSPQRLIKHILDIKNPDLYIQSFRWNIKLLNVSDLSQSTLQIVILIKYTGDIENEEQLITKIEGYIGKLNNLFPEYKIGYNLNREQSYDLSHHRIHYIEFIVNKKLKD